MQWSKSWYPFRPAGARLTFATSLAWLPLRPNTWWYRVRGFDYNLPTGAQAMAWSAPIRLMVSAPKLQAVDLVTHHKSGHFKVVKK